LRSLATVVARSHIQARSLAGRRLGAGSESTDSISFFAALQGGCSPTLRRWPAQALIERKAMLRHLLNKADDDVLRFSETFPDPVKLLAAAESQGLEGIVSNLPFGEEPRLDQGQVPGLARGEQGEV